MPRIRPRDAAPPADPAQVALAAALTSPQSVSGDAGSVTMPSIPDLIAAANYLAGLRGALGGGSGMRFTRLVPDGAAGWGSRLPCCGSFNRIC